MKRTRPAKVTAVPGVSVSASYLAIGSRGSAIALCLEITERPVQSPNGNSVVVIGRFYSRLMTKGDRCGYESHAKGCIAEVANPRWKRSLNERRSERA